MARVYSYQAFVACEIKEESSWGVDPGTWGTDAYRVPFVGEDLHYDQELIPVAFWRQAGNGCKHTMSDPS